MLKRSLSQLTMVPVYPACCTALSTYLQVYQGCMYVPVLHSLSPKTQLSPLVADPEASTQVADQAVVAICPFSPWWCGVQAELLCPSPCAPLFSFAPPPPPDVPVLAAVPAPQGSAVATCC